MKTFEEAMKLRLVKSADIPAGMEAISRYNSLVEEIGTSKLTSIFIRAIAEVEPPEEIAADMDDEDRFFSVLVTAFINGVMVGIEMEKSE